jgi:hypothetical protein
VDVAAEAGKEGEEEEEEEGECGFCLFMKDGGCKEEFVAWRTRRRRGRKATSATMPCHGRAQEVQGRARRLLQAHPARHGRGPGGRTAIRVRARPLVVPGATAGVGGRSGAEEPGG